VFAGCPPRDQVQVTLLDDPSTVEAIHIFGLGSKKSPPSTISQFELAAELDIEDHAAAASAQHMHRHLGSPL
jgi:hypothetical protein